MANQEDKRFLINKDEDNLEVHDLTDQRKGCQIDEIVDYEYLEGTTIEFLEEWLAENPSYDGCEYCLEEYHEK